MKLVKLAFLLFIAVIAYGADDMPVIIELTSAETARLVAARAEWNAAVESVKRAHLVTRDTVVVGLIPIPAEGSNPDFQYGASLDIGLHHIVEGQKPKPCYGSDTAKAHTTESVDKDTIPSTPYLPVKEK